MTPMPEPSTPPSDDDRWIHGMNGWRIKVIAQNPELRGRRGEVTGFEHGAGPHIYVVLDGEEEPRKFWWSEVHPV